MFIFRNHLFRTIVVILAGVVLIGLSIYNIWQQMRMEMSPFDVVDAPSATSTRANTPTPLPAVVASGTEAAVQTLAEENAITSGVSLEEMPEATSAPGGGEAGGYLPERIVIEKIKMDAPIVPVSVKEVKFEGKIYQQWLAPNEFAAGWHNTSALLGVPGNTVLNGHHNVYGEVFGNIVRLREGDIIKLYSGAREFVYRVARVMLLPEKYKTVEDRMENARWILPSDDERITLITCWPKASNTHRVIIVALPYTEP